jgi:hypothetical protein
LPLRLTPADIDLAAKSERKATDDAAEAAIDA